MSDRIALMADAVVAQLNAIQKKHDDAVRAEGFREGIEAAAKLADACSEYWIPSPKLLAQRIRALADPAKPERGK